jgi:hypothetical protein
MTKAVIHFGQSTPDTRLLRQHVDYWEGYLPFDGLVIPVNPVSLAGRYGYALRENKLPVSETSLSWTLLSHPDSRLEDYEHAIQDLAAIHSRPTQQFIHNFLPVYFYSWNSWPNYPFDWFNQDHWDTLIRNIKILATIAKDGGCKGLCLDPEHYYGAVFNFLCCRSQNPHAPQDFEIYRNLLRSRGEDFMDAITAIYPNCTILLTFGSCYVHDDVVGLQHSPHSLDKETCLPLDLLVPTNPDSTAILNNARYVLLAPFLDGMMLAARNNSEITDGFELAYRYRADEGKYSQAELIVRQECKAYSINPECYANRIRLGLGIYPTEPGQEFSADESKEAVRLAKKYSDRYVWIWSGKSNFFWKEGNDPQIADQASIECWQQESPHLPPANTTNVLQEGSKPVPQEIVNA